MPGDGFAFPIGVGRQNELVGLFDRLGDLAHDLLGFAVNLPVHHEIVVGLDRAVLRRQVPDVPVRCDDLVARTQIFVDRLGLSGGFDDNDVHLALSLLGPPTTGPGPNLAAYICGRAAGREHG